MARPTGSTLLRRAVIAIAVFIAAIFVIDLLSDFRRRGRILTHGKHGDLVSVDQLYAATP